MRTSPLSLAAVLVVFLADLAPVPCQAAALERTIIPWPVQGMTVPVPSLEYTLVYERIEQVPGNAALAYQRVASLLGSSQEWNDQREKCREWLEVPLDAFPAEAVRVLLAQQANNLEQLVKATQYEDCDWGIAVREEGLHALLPHLSPMRDAARLLALEVRFLVHEGRFEEAVGRLRAGFTLAQHISDGDLLIESLVGLAVANQMLDRVEELVTQPGAPNLYWALTDRSADAFSAWRAVRWERSFIYVHFPMLWKARTEAVTLDDVHRSMIQLGRLTSDIPRIPGLGEDESAAVLSAGFALVVYPKARQQLLAQGMARETLEEMSVVQLLVTYIGRGYDLQRDNLFKWFGLPYREAREGLERARLDLATAVEEDPIQTLLPSILLPALGSVVERFAELEQRLALLRCAEAVRDYVARHDGRLPDTLAEIEVLPVPVDPMTGEAFVYDKETPTAVLSTPERPRLRQRVYEIKIRP